MAERWATKTGNWNDVSVWDGGASLPAAGDDVYANGYTVTINGNYTAVCLHTNAGSTAVAGGLFQTSGAVTITANSQAGTTRCLTVNAGGVQVGNSTGGSVNTAHGTYCTNGGIQNGNSTGGSYDTAYGTYAYYGGVQNGNSASGSASGAHGTYCVNGGIQNGNAVGGNTGGAYGTYCLNGGIHNGNSTGGSASTAYGTFCTNGGKAFCPLVTGTVAGAYGLVTAANSGSLAYILAESGDYPKSLGANTDATLNNWSMGWMFTSGMIWPAEANVEVAETAWGPTGAEYAGELDLAAAEAAAASTQHDTDAEFLETNKAEIIPGDTAIQAEFGVTGMASVGGARSPIGCSFIRGGIA